MYYNLIVTRAASVMLLYSECVIWELPIIFKGTVQLVRQFVPVEPAESVGEWVIDCTVGDRSGARD